MSGDAHLVRGEAELRRIYSEPSRGVREKAIDHIDDFAKRFIALSPFLCIGTSRPDDLADVSPRGGEPGFVEVLDSKQLALPDRPGNNRLDTLTNLIRAPAVGLLFVIPGFDDILRINGTASISIDPELLQRFAVNGRTPRSVLVISVAEVYRHCSKALRRSDLWNPAKHIDPQSLPSWGEMLREQKRTILPARLIDFALRQDAKRNLY